MNYLSNWATTDQLSTRILVEPIRDEPEIFKELERWTESRNRWRRSAAPVTLVPLARKGLMLDESLMLADPLMTDGMTWFSRA